MTARGAHPPTRRTALAGLALALLYAAACALTLGTGRLRVRPLFEGFAPPAPYRWVNPPPRFAAGNVKPSSATATIPVEGGRTVARALATDDGQFLSNLGAGAVAATTATEVQAKATPVDPATLGPLPSGLFADGNAYRFELSLSPGGAPVGTLAAPGNVVLVLPANGTAIAFSPDGRAWQQLATQAVGNTHTTLGVSFDRPGFFLGVAASDVTGAAGAPGSKSGGTSVWTVVLVAAAAVILVGALVVGPLAWRRRSRPANRARPGKGQGGGNSGGGKGPGGKGGGGKSSGRGGRPPPRRRR